MPSSSQLSPNIPLSARMFIQSLQYSLQDFDNMASFEVPREQVPVWVSIDPASEQINTRRAFGGNLQLEPGFSTTSFVPVTTHSINPTPGTRVRELVVVVFKLPEFKAKRDIVCQRVEAELNRLVIEEEVELSTNKEQGKVESVFSARYTNVSHRLLEDIDKNGAASCPFAEALRLVI